MWKDKNCVQPKEALSNVPRFVNIADEVFYWGIDRNITSEGGASALSQVVKLKEEVEELEESLMEGVQDEIEKEIGDIQVVLLNVCRLGGFDLATCLEKTYDKIKDRKGTMKDGVFVKEEDGGN